VLAAPPPSLFSHPMLALTAFPRKAIC
jgi:hypothetical protein